MRIISDFRDYYDSVQAYGADYNLVYDRKKSDEWVRNEQLPLLPIHELCPFAESNGSLHGEPCFTDYFKTVMVVFCGKVYYGITAKMKYNNSTEYFPITVDGIAAFEKMLREYGKVQWGFDGQWLIEEMNRIDGIKRPLRWYNSPRFTLKNLRKFAEALKAYHRDAQPDFNLHARVKTPIWSTTFHAKNLDSKLNEDPYGVRHTLVTVNPELKASFMPKIVDSYSAYQSLEMFMGNFMLPEDNAPQITDDVVLRDAKGFDRMSFKKENPVFKKE